MICVNAKVILSTKVPNLPNLFKALAFIENKG